MIEIPVVDPLTFSFILAGALAAGFVDAVAGGGGLISTPILLLALPGAPLAGVLATTKCSSLAGTAGAAVSYTRKMAMPWRLLLPGMAAALPAAWLGARTVSHLDPSLLRPAILAVLIAMALYTWWRPESGFGFGKSGGIPPAWQPYAGALTGAVLGFYDGFLGPGTGSMLVLVLIAVFGRDFLRASGAAKYLNLASNLGALLWFAPAGAVMWRLALPMACCNLLGGVLGSRMALKAGNRWIRGVFLAVVLALIARLAWSLFHRT
ncbi:MAG: hypothetical protein JWO30_4873 [Fibrobacteres bacterium]|nr:hypothetical protein [Fibrobacterota bacterium]